MAEMAKFPRIEQICVYLVLLLTVVNCQCNRGRIRHTLTYHNCQPKRLLSWGCAGTCQAYSRPSSTVPGDIEHFCECCKHTEFETRRTILQCPSTDGLSFRRIAVRVNIPSGCACRPCSALPHHILSAEEELRNGKRTSKNQTVKNVAPFAYNETIEDVDDVDSLK
ncbi:Bursicon [Mizuhopecten yessoensis]|uniref:Bursicon n=1 Tax=Mizuhopecten yessoensis TaxID=6573 RepID=A0A210R5R2_MIZYE|nr:bursicon alpha 1 [Mizuhopecten yessoensis]OWF56234.1 Bursicon [Mizuhopecten yessoensis]